MQIDGKLKNKQEQKNYQLFLLGKHEELMKTSDVYREIYEAQTRGSKKREGGEA